MSELTQKIMMSSGGDVLPPDTWDISTATFVPKAFYSLNSILTVTANGSQSKVIGNTESNPKNFVFKPDGTMVYLVGPTRIHQFSLPTPWAISTSVFVRTLNIGSYETNANDVSFSDDGTEMYVIGTNQDKVIAFELSTAWDISTATFAPKKFYELNSLLSPNANGFQTEVIGGTETNPKNFVFKPNGTMFYLVGPSKIHQFSLSTPWSISTSALVHSLNIGSYETNANDVSFNSDGTEMYIVGTDEDKILTFELSTPWTVSTAKYAPRDSWDLKTTIDNGGTTSFSVGTARESMYFRADGLKMYVIGSGVVSEYNLTEPYDVTTAAFVQSLSVSNFESSPTGVSFDADGTEMYVLGSDEDKIITYALSTPWNISTATFTPKNFYSLNSILTVTANGSQSEVIGNRETNPKNFVFKPDGTKVYLVGPSKIHEFNLPTPWAISTSVFVRTLNIGSYETNANDVSFSDDGTIMHIIGTNQDKVIAFELSTAWDISTASYVPKKFYELNSLLSPNANGFQLEVIGSIESNPKNFVFKPDGTMFYLVGPSRIHQLSLSTPWSISTSSLVHSLNIASQETNANDVSFNSDGTEMYVVGTVSDTILTYNLSTPWAISSATFTSSFSISGQEVNPYGLTFKPDGTKAYIVGDGSDRVFEYNLSTPFDTSTLSYSGASFNILPQETLSRGVRFSQDGTKMFIIGFTRTIYEYSLSTAWSVASATFVRSFTFPWPTTTDLLQGFSFNDDGSILYVTEYTPNTPTSSTIQQWDLGGIDISSQEVNPYGLTFKPDGTKAYIVGETSDRVFEYNLTTPFDTSTLTYSNSFFSILSQETSSRGVRFSQDGTKMFIIGFTRNIFEYSLSTAWSVASATFVRSFTFPWPTSSDYLQGFSFNDVGSILYVTEYTPNTPTSSTIQQWDLGGIDISSKETNPRGLTFKPDGSKMYIVGGSSVHEYNLSIPFDTSTLTHISSFAAQSTINGLYFRSDGAKAYIAANSLVYEYNLNTPWSTSSTSMSLVQSFSVGNTPQDVWFNPVGTVMHILDSTRIEQWDLGGVDISGQEVNPYGLTFKPDGTKAYIVGDGSDRVFEYNLSIPFDTSTLSYSNSFFIISTQETSSRGVRFSQDGTKMFIIGFTRNIFEYSLSTAWSVSTATFVRSFTFPWPTTTDYLQGFSFNDDGSILYVTEYTPNTPTSSTIQQWDLGGVDISGQEVNPYGLTFKPDGTKAYIVGETSDRVHEYNLSTPFDTSTLTYSGASFIISSQETSSRGVRFSQDGTKMFIIGFTRTIYEYSLSTAWSVSTATYVRNFTFSWPTSSDYLQGFSFNDDGSILYVTEYTPNTPTSSTIQQWDLGGIDISSKETNPKEIVFKPDGSKMYIIGQSGNSIHQYSLNPIWDISTAVFLNTFTPSISAINGLYFRSDGAKAYIAANSLVYEYDLNVPWDVSTASMSLVQSFSVGNTPQGVWFNPVGTVMHILDSTRIEQWDLGGVDISGQEVNPYGLTFKPDGTKAYIVGDGSDRVFEYNLTTPFDTSTLSYSNSFFSILPQETSSRGVRFSQDGTKMFIIGFTRNIFEYSLSTAWSVSTATFVRSFTFPWPTTTDLLQGFSFNDDGSILYVTEYTPNTPTSSTIQQWDLGGVDISGQEVNPYGLTFKPDGTKAYIVGETSDRVHEYNLSTPFDTSTLSYSNSFFIISSQETSSRGVRFSQDGTKMFIIGFTRNIFEYSLSTAWSVSTATFVRSFTFPWPTSSDYLQGFSFNDVGSILYVTEYTPNTPTSSTIQQWDLGGVDISGQEVNPKEIVFKPDGSKMYIVGGSSVHEYNLSIPFDTSTLTHISSFAAQSTINGIYFRSDGAKAYIAANSLVYEYNLSTPWSTRSTSMSLVQSFSVGNTPQGVWFNPDGTVMHILDSTRIEQWDLGGVGISGQEVTPYGLTFKPDGTKAYIVGDGSDRVFEYNLSTPFDTSTLTYSNSFFSILSQETSSRGVRFSQDGTKMFIIGFTRTIYEYSLSTAWSVSTATFVRSFTFPWPTSSDYLQGFSFNDDGSILYVTEYTPNTPTSSTIQQWDLGGIDISSQEANPYGLTFKPDGTKAYIVGQSSDRVYEYNLSTPFDTSTLSYSNASFSVSNQETHPFGVRFSQDGTKMFVIGQYSRTIFEYSLSTAWSVASATYVRNFTFTTFPADHYLQGFSFNDDGSILYVTEYDTASTSETIQQWDVATPWNLSSLSFSASSNITSIENNPRNLFFKSDGTKVYLVGSSKIHEFNLSTPWSITTRALVHSLNIGSYETNANDVSFSNDGTEMYVIGTSQDKVLTFELSTPWSVATATYTPKTFFDLKSLITTNSNGFQTEVIGGTETNPKNFVFKPDGTMFYLVGPSKIHQFSLSTPWSISTSAVVHSLNIGSYETNANDVSFNTTGTEMYIVGIDEDKILTFELSTPWTVSTAKYAPRDSWDLKTTIDNGGTTSFSVGVARESMYFRADGLKMYVIGSGVVSEYNLSQSYNVTTAAFVQSFSVSNFESSPTGVSFKSDGTEMYVLGTDEDKIITYALSTPWNISTATFVPKNFYSLNSILTVTANGSQSEVIGSVEPNPKNFVFKPDGTMVYLVGPTRIHQFSLPTPWAISTSVFVRTLNIGSYETNANDVSFSDDGTKMHIIGTNQDKVIAFDLSTAWDISTASYVPKKFYELNSLLSPNANGFQLEVIGNTESNPKNFAFKPDGTMFYLVGPSKIHQFSLSTPWSISTSALVHSLNIGSYETNANDVSFNTTGTEMYVVGTDEDKVLTFELSTPWTVSTAKYAPRDSWDLKTTIDNGGTTSFSVGAARESMYLRAPDGLKMYVIGSGVVSEYNLTEPYDVTTAAFVQSFSVANFESSPTSISFDADGTEMYVLGSDEDKIITYRLGTYD